MSISENNAEKHCFESNPESRELYGQANTEIPSRESFIKRVAELVDKHTISVPARKGETYSQILDRMFPLMKKNDLKTLAVDTAELNQHKNLSEEDRFEILSEYGKKLLKEAILKDFDHKYGDSSECKLRSRFSPAYEVPMRVFKERIFQEAESAAAKDLTKTKTQSSQARVSDQSREQKKNSSSAGLHYFDTTDNAIDNELSRPQESKQKENRATDSPTKEDDIFSEQTLSNFVDACHEFAKRSESLLFLSKWYDQDSHMYQWGEKKFQEAFEKSKQNFEKVQKTIKDDVERDRIDKEWQGFLARQKACLADLNQRLHWL